MVRNNVEEQYSVGKILFIWAIVAVPMPIMAFVIAPAVTPYTSLAPVIVSWLFMILGMVWQFVVSLIILKRELQDLSWTTIRKRIWLQHPTNPKTGEKSTRLYWWLIPAFIVYLIFENSPLTGYFSELTLRFLPFLANVPPMDLTILTTPEYVGAWWLFGLAVFSSVFNYLLGEELLFRGVLLPKMKGAFGTWDWAMNAVLFATYHLIRPTTILAIIFGGMAWSYPSRRFKSIWFAVILHGLEGLVLLGAVFAIVTGLAF